MQQVVMPFDGKVIETVMGEDGKPWISVRGLCEAIGVDAPTQVEKIKRDERFNRWHIPSVARDGKNREMFCIPLEHLNGWLFSIQPNRVREEIRPNLIAYQQECFQVLYNHFMPNGVQDLQSFMARFEERFDAMDEKFDNLNGVTAAIFGDDKEEIESLIKQVSRVYNVTGRDVWVYLQEKENVASYKRQNRMIMNHLRNLLDAGLKQVSEGRVGNLYGRN